MQQLADQRIDPAPHVGSFLHVEHQHVVAAANRFFIGAAGQDDYRYRPKPFVGGHHLADAQAAAGRHVDVEDHQVGPHAVDGVDRFERRVDAEHRTADRTESLREQLHQIAVVVGHDDLPSHGVVRHADVRAEQGIGFCCDMVIGICRVFITGIRPDIITGIRLSRPQWNRVHRKIAWADAGSGLRLRGRRLRHEAADEWIKHGPNVGRLEQIVGAQLLAQFHGLSVVAAGEDDDRHAGRPRICAERFAESQSIAGRHFDVDADDVGHEFVDHGRCRQQVPRMLDVQPDAAAALADDLQ